MIFSIPYIKTQNQPLPLSLRVLGIHYQQEPIRRQNGLPFFQWFYCIKGCGELIINNQKSIVIPGQGAFIYPQIPHSYHGLTPDWTIHFFGFSGPNCIELLKTLQMHESGVYHFSDQNTFPMHIQKLYNLHEQHVQNKTAEYSKECYSFLLDLSPCIRYIHTSALAQDNPFVQKIITYMEEHYAGSITLNDLAEHVQLSKEYMCTLFKQTMQQTIMHYLTTIRISHARIFLLQFPEKKIFEIARMCGFDSPSYFGKIFKKDMGITPDNYRQGKY